MQRREAVQMGGGGSGAERGLSRLFKRASRASRSQPSTVPRREHIFDVIPCCGGFAQVLKNSAYGRGEGSERTSPASAQRRWAAAVQREACGSATAATESSATACLHAPTAAIDVTAARCSVRSSSDPELASERSPSLVIVNRRFRASHKVRAAHLTPPACVYRATVAPLRPLRTPIGRY